MEVYPPSKNRTGGRTERTKTVPNDQSFKNVPNDYLGMSCGEEDKKALPRVAAELLEGDLVVRAR